MRDQADEKEYPSDWSSRRREVYKRDDYTCQNCGDRGGPHGDVELHAHHIVPKSEGGRHHLNNLTTLCYDCHNTAHDHYIPRQTSTDYDQRDNSESTNGVGTAGGEASEASTDSADEVSPLGALLVVGIFLLVPITIVYISGIETLIGLIIIMTYIWFIQWAV